MRPWGACKSKLFPFLAAASRNETCMGLTQSRSSTEARGAEAAKQSTGTQRPSQGASGSREQRKGLGGTRGHRLGLESAVLGCRGLQQISVLGSSKTGGNRKALHVTHHSLVRPPPRAARKGMAPSLGQVLISSPAGSRGGCMSFPPLP